MTSPSYGSDEDFLGSLEFSFDEIDLMADADTHASMTGVFAQVSSLSLCLYIIYYMGLRPNGGFLGLRPTCEFLGLRPNCEFLGLRPNCDFFRP